MTTLTLDLPSHQYVRVCFSGEAGGPWMSLYEIDSDGTVLRHAQMYAEGSRFAPEHILIRSEVELSFLLAYPGAELLDRATFEQIWSDYAPDRPFYRTLPDCDQSWTGMTRLGPHDLRVLWMPNTHAPPGWSSVPGFTRLFAKGGSEQARRVGAAVFCDAPFRWSALHQLAA